MVLSSLLRSVLTVYIVSIHPDKNAFQPVHPYPNLKITLSIRKFPPLFGKVSMVPPMQITCITTAMVRVTCSPKIVHLKALRCLILFLEQSCLRRQECGIIRPKSRPEVDILTAE